MELNFLNFNEYSLKAQSEGFESIVAGLINRKEFIILSATAKTGKSMLAINMGIGVACGLDFLGMPTIKGKVLYLQTEVSPSQLTERISKMSAQLNDDFQRDFKENLYICDDSIRLDQQEGLKSLIKAIQEKQPSLVILDPFYTLHRKKEDSSDEMAPILSSIKKIAKEQDCAVLLIHHQGKKNDHSSGQVGHSHRGSSSFGDVPDASLSLSKKDKNVILKGEFRNRAPLEPLEYSIDSETLNLKLQSLTAAKPKAKEFILEALKANETDKRTASYLKSLLREKTGLGDSSFNKAIQELKSTGEVITDGSFKNTTYRLNAISTFSGMKDDNTLPF